MTATSEPCANGHGFDAPPTIGMRCRCGRVQWVGATAPTDATEQKFGDEQSRRCENLLNFSHERLVGGISSVACQLDKGHPGEHWNAGIAWRDKPALAADVLALVPSDLHEDFAAFVSKGVSTPALNAAMNTNPEVQRAVEIVLHTRLGAIQELGDAIRLRPPGPPRRPPSDPKNRDFA